MHTPPAADPNALTPDPHALNIHALDIGDAKSHCDREVAALRDIYNHFVRHDRCTFELEPLSLETMRQRIVDRQSRWGFMVARRAGTVLGFAYYGRFRDRAAYDHVVETSIYLQRDHLGQGIGRRLYAALLEHATLRGFAQAIAVLALPNPASEALHRSLGYEFRGSLLGSGIKFGQTIDTAYYQRALTAPS